MTGWYFSYVLAPAPSLTSPQVVVTIPKGASVKEISKILSQSGVIKYDVRFLLLARFSGLGTKLRAGEFQLETGLLPREVLVAVSTAKPVHHAVTIPEGLNVAEISKLLENNGWAHSKLFLNLIRDKDFIEELGLSGIDSLEGYLFPDTYYFTIEVKGSRDIIKMMVDRFHVVWAKLSDGIDPPPNMQKTVTLASIVEKETGDAKERDLIAGVFLNRLRLGMRLQSDPTVLYGIDETTGPITKTHLRTPTPYNTYVISGLPIGPICSPGAEALHAVLHPKVSKKLYFVSKNDGTHQFSSNLREHNRAVMKYQRKKSVKKGK